MSTSSPATEATRHSLTEASAALPLHDRQDFEDAERGLVARTADRQVLLAPIDPNFAIVTP